MRRNILKGCFSGISAALMLNIACVAAVFAVPEGLTVMRINHNFFTVMMVCLLAADKIKSFVISLFCFLPSALLLNFLFNLTGMIREMFRTQFEYYGGMGGMTAFFESLFRILISVSAALIVTAIRAAAARVTAHRKGKG